MRRRIETLGDVVLFLDDVLAKAKADGDALMLKRAKTARRSVMAAERLIKDIVQAGFVEDDGEHNPDKEWDSDVVGEIANLLHGWADGADKEMV